MTHTAQVSEWVWMSELWETISHEVGIPPVRAKGLLRSEFTSLRISTRVPGMSPYFEHLFEKEGLLRVQRNVPSPSVTEGGWADMGAHWSAGKLRDWNIEVCWADVVQLLGDMYSQSEVDQRQPSPSADKKKKRAPTGLNFQLDDQPLIKAMHSLIEAGDASSIWNAALAVADRAKGSRNSQSKAKRLVRGYSAAFSAEHGRKD